MDEVAIADAAIRRKLAATPQSTAERESELVSESPTEPTALAEVIPASPIEAPSQPQNKPAKKRKPRGLAKRTELILEEYDRRIACGEICTAISLRVWWQKLSRDKKSGVGYRQISFNDNKPEWEARAIKNIGKMIREHRTGKKNKKS